MPEKRQRAGSDTSRQTTTSNQDGEAPEPQAAPRLFTPISPFRAEGAGLVPIVLRPGQLVDENDPVYKMYPDRFTKPKARQYK